MALKRPLHRAVFLDKDGTLIQDVPYNCDPALIRLMPNCINGLRAIAAAGFLLIVVTNQSGIALGLIPESSMSRVETRLRELLRSAGIEVAGFYYCPHLPESKILQYRRECDCRKPMPGMLHRAAAELQLDLAGSWMIGDILDDVEAGRRAGCRTILVANGHEDQWRITPVRVPDYAVPDIDQAALMIEAAAVQQQLESMEAP